MRRMTGQLLLILYSFLFLLLSPADLNFVVGFLVSWICIGMQMFLKDDWERGGRYNKVTLKKVSKIKCFRSFSQHRNEALLP